MNINLAKIRAANSRIGSGKENEIRTPENLKNFVDQEAQKSGNTLLRTQKEQNTL